MASNIYVDTGRLHGPRYVSLQRYACVKKLLLGRQHVYLTFNGKRVHLHDLRSLPSGTTVRLVRYPIKGGGLQEKLQVHSRESLRSRTKQEVRAIATAIGVHLAGGSRQARAYFSKNELIDRILQKLSDKELSAEVGEMQSASSSSAASSALRSSSVGPPSGSSQSSLAHMFAAQRDRRAQADTNAPSSAFEPVSISSSSSSSKLLSRHNKHYAKTGERKYQREGRVAAKERYEKGGRVAAKERYEKKGRVAAKERYEKEGPVKYKREAVRRCAFMKRSYKSRFRAAKKKV